jgi:hypothetical protein
MSLRGLRVFIRLFPVVVLIAVATSCGEEGPYQKETIPVSGRIVVDGKPPGSTIQILAHEKGGMDKEHPTVTQGTAAEDGTFSMTTYTTGDGMPPGEYVLTFTWQEFRPFSMSYGGPDKLKGRYSDPKKSEITLTVQSGDDPINLGDVQLTTKGLPAGPESQIRHEGVGFQPQPPK